MAGLTGMLWGGFVRLFLVHHVMWTSGSTAHILGFRPFDTGDRSTNNPLLAYANFGEAYHNNHHAFPYSARFGLRWWQFDLGGWTILLVQKAGLGVGCEDAWPGDDRGQEEDPRPDTQRGVDRRADIRSSICARRPAPQRPRRM